VVEVTHEIPVALVLKKLNFLGDNFEHDLDG
jgi:hypothetical protein